MIRSWTSRLLANKAKFIIGIIGVIGLMALGTACGGNGITVDDLTGTWRNPIQGGVVYGQINADGTYRIGPGYTTLEQTPYAVGQFTLEGTLVTMITTLDRFCEVGGRTVWEVELVDENRMRWVRQGEDEFCGPGAGFILNLERFP